MSFYFSDEHFTKRDRMSAHLATVMATQHNYSLSVIREKLAATSLLPSQFLSKRAHGTPSQPLTSMVLASYAKDYHPVNNVRMPLFGNLKEIFYKPFENLPPTDLLPRHVRNFSRIMGVGLLRSDEALVHPDKTEHLDRYINIACLHID